MHCTLHRSHPRDRSVLGRSSAWVAAIGCVVSLTAQGCALRSTPDESALEQAADVEPASSAPAAAANTRASSAAAAADGGSGQSASAVGKPAAGSGSVPSASSAAPTQAATTTPATPAVPASSSSPTQPPSNSTAAAKPPVKAMDDDAGTPPQADAGAISTAMQQKCDADLSSCLLKDPLGYDVCLRKNAEQGCPPSETPGASTTTPVLDENGNPISQVCQAELAKCIMRLPTPENAAECMDAARKCK